MRGPIRELLTVAVPRILGNVFDSLLGRDHAAFSSVASVHRYFHRWLTPAALVVEPQGIARDMDRAQPMDSALERLCNLGDPDTRRKLFRYALASGVNIVIGEGILAVTFGVFGWTARSAAVLAAVLAAFPAYFLARRWVWGRSGRSHLLKEVLPFWTLALLGLGITTLAASVGEQVGADARTRLTQTVVVMAFVLGASGVFWVIRFLLLNRVLFSDRGR